MKKIFAVFTFFFIFCLFLGTKEVFSGIEDSLDGYISMSVEIDGDQYQIYYKEVFRRTEDGDSTERKSIAEYYIKDRQSGDTDFFVKGKRSSPRGRFYDIYWPKITKDELTKDSILQKMAVEKDVYEATAIFRSILTQIDNELYPD